jgi:hypothetical protein
MEDNLNGAPSPVVFDMIGPDVSEMTEDQASAEWREMTLKMDSEKYRNFPTKKLLERRDQLFERGFRRKLDEQEKQRAEATDRLIADEMDRHERWAAQDELAKARRAVASAFGGEQKAREAISSVRNFFKSVAARDYEGVKDFLETTYAVRGREKVLLGNSPRLIKLAYEASRNKDLVKHIKGIGIEKFIRLKAAELGWTLTEE